MEIVNGNNNVIESIGIGKVDDTLTDEFNNIQRMKTVKI
jgi:hypothetical protein